MEKITLIATAAFGLEAVTKREIIALGYEVTDAKDGRIEYKGDLRAIVRSNLWLRSADRVYIKLADFTAKTFDELFTATEKLPWEEWIKEDSCFIVNGSSARSVLHSVPACQSIVEKAIIKRLSGIYGIEQFSKTGPRISIRFMLQKDECIMLIDTSGAGLHKRGYRVKTVAAPIKETLASAMVQLSFFKEGRLMADPFCGSGTIAIEAAMLARNIAPGLSRDFDARAWRIIPEELWKEEKELAFKAINNDAQFVIQASDIDPKAVKAARENAIEAGVDDCIDFKVMDARKLFAEEEKGMIITNPPYGVRIGEEKLNQQIYRSLAAFIKQNPTWSLFLITSDKGFEKAFGRNADRRRKLYNGRIESCYYQYYGEK